MFRFLLVTLMSLFLLGITSVEGRVVVLELQTRFGMERLCEDETTHVSPVELRVEMLERGRMPYRPSKRESHAPVYASRPIILPARRPQSPRAPPHLPRAPP